MSVSRNIIVDSLSVRENIKPGDILIFEQPEVMAAKAQGLVLKKGENQNLLHAAVVVGMTVDKVPIISHMVLSGQRTERLDCSFYKDKEFALHRARHSNFSDELAKKMNLHPDVTEVLAKTDSRYINDNLAIYDQLIEMDLLGKTELRTNTETDLKYSSFKVVRAALSALFGKPTSPTNSRKPVDLSIDTFHKAPKSAENAYRDKSRLEKYGDQMCSSLVMTAIIEASNDLKANANSNNTRGKKNIDAPDQFSILFDHARTDLLPAQLNTLLTEANSIFATTHSTKMRDMSNVKQKSINFRGAEWVYESKKQGGANAGGELTGVYVLNDRAGNTAARGLLKQDVPAKTIGECAAFMILDDIYQNIMGINENRYAAIFLGRCDGGKIDEDGTKTYMMSIYIKGYQDDLWRYAYREKFVKEYRDRLSGANENKDLNNNEREELLEFVILQRRKIADKIKKLDPVKNKDLIEKLNKELHLQTFKMNILAGIDDNSMPEANYSQLNEEFIKDLAEIKVSKMNRPSGAFFAPGNTEARRVITDFLAKNPKLLEEFSQLVAPRILLGDFGLHNADFGVSLDEQGIPHIVALDYGAAFLNMIGDLNPYDMSKTGIRGLSQFYKNHFLEYGNEVIFSDQMANAFVKMKNMTEKDIKAYAKSAIDDVFNHYGLNPIVEFCNRMGMKIKLPSDGSEMKMSELKQQMLDFLCPALLKRQESLRDIGYSLLLENCYTSDMSQTLTNLYQAIQKEPGLANYLNGGFRTNELISYDDHALRDTILECHQILTTYPELALYAAIKNKNEAVINHYVLKHDIDEKTAKEALRQAKHFGNKSSIEIFNNILDDLSRVEKNQTINQQTTIPTVSEPSFATSRFSFHAHNNTHTDRSMPQSSSRDHKKIK